LNQEVVAMLFSRWFGRRAPRSCAAEGHTFRPTLCVLEDRTVPSGFGALTKLFQAPGPATHFQVVLPANVQATKPFDVVVKAEDASNHLATGYKGTVQFSLGLTDAGATGLGNYTFTKGDHGLHVFHVTLTATGSQTLTAKDTVTSSITGSATTTVNPAPVATHLLVITPEHIPVGVPTHVKVEALDASNHVVPGYTGTTNFTNTDTAATGLPASYQFTTSDHGKHTFQVIFNTPGTQTVTATDSVTASITGQASLTVNAVGPVTHFALLVERPVLLGASTQVYVAALDASNQLVANYTGTVQLTTSASTTPLVSAPFTATDHGIHLFTVTFGTSGKQTLTATDTANGTILGSTHVKVLTHLTWWGLSF